ncbi:uncharacterized protein CLAFUR5_09826 [Fulvia fulva]|uniref:DUF7708 domain-containing protein n=1 Tax=Passalora fulva TaxID=5499 RepID=A0A9Q8PCB2_PASFU|nr:uncharacterized protein CLAFUR5_09826 [Fulvia fulva]UJO19848.1 hypothetical protein CLAFUR5_09826 [Fulvia fulva]
MSSFVQQYIQAVPVCGMLISLPLLMHTEDDGSLWDRCSSSTYLRFGGCYQYVASQQPLSVKVYKFLKAMHDAPEEIREYLDVLGRSLHEQRVARERTPLRAALDRFQGNSDDAMAAFESAPAWDEIMDHIGALNQTRPPHSSAAPSSLTESAVQSPAGAFYGGIKIILSTAARIENEVDSVANALLEMTEVIEVCNRERQLYESDKLSRMIADCYLEVLNVLRLSLQEIQGRRFMRTLMASMDNSYRSELDKAMTTIRRISDSILREVDYQHRLEMRETSSRVIDMQFQQHKMLALLENQQSILQEMDEERKVMTATQGQQEVLQAIQPIERQLQSQIGSNIQITTAH